MNVNKPTAKPPTGEPYRMTTYSVEKRASTLLKNVIPKKIKNINPPINPPSTPSTPQMIVYAVTGKDSRPQNLHRQGGDSGGIIIKIFTSIPICLLRGSLRSQSLRRLLLQEMLFSE